MVCPLCGTAAKRHLVLPHTEVWRCQSGFCDLQFASPQLDDEQLSRAYQQLYYPGNGTQPAEALDPTSDTVLRQFFDEVKRQHPDLAGKRLLDYGCGPAVLSSVARQYGMLPTGIEADPNARAQVRAAGTCPIYANLEELLAAEPDAQFDWVVLWNVIEHLRYPWLEVRSLRRVCAPGGVLIVTTPNAECLRGRLERARWDQRLNLTHFYYFTRTSLAATLRAAGCSRIVSRDKFTAYPHHGPLRRLAQRLLVACRLDGKLEFSATPDNDLPA